MEKSGWKNLINAPDFCVKFCKFLEIPAEIVLKILDFLNEEEADTEDLEYISATISERDYYQNTNK